MRPALGRIAVLCLLFQVGTIASAHAVLWAAAADNCACAIADHGMCPMHHAAAPNAKRCIMRSASDHTGVALTSLIGVTGHAPSFAGFVISEQTSSLPWLASSPVAARFTSPDSPPPRL